MFTSIVQPLRRRPAGAIAGAVVASLIFAACGSSDSDSSDATDDAPIADEEAVDETSDQAGDTADETVTTDANAVSDDGAASATAVDLALFFDGALAGDAVIEDCTLSGGAETTCYTLTAAGYPTSYEVSQFCPTTITDENGGLWWDGDSLYDLNGEFIENLAEIYGDDAWQMYDEDGNVLVTETAEEFELAARPDVDPSLQNHCVEGRLEWLENGEPITATVQIPTEPVAADAAAVPQGNQGVTFDGVVIANSAPVDAILGAYTIAAFDDCGAHFNPFDGYHLHGAVGCSELTGDDLPEGETPQFGYAMDGYPLHSPLDEASDFDLDECNGHETAELGYHYHANSAEQNQVVECLVGQTVASNDAGGGPPDGPPAEG